MPEDSGPEDCSLPSTPRKSSESETPEPNILQNFIQSVNDDVSSCTPGAAASFGDSTETSSNGSSTKKKPATPAITLLKREKVVSVDDAASTTSVAATIYFDFEEDNPYSEHDTIQDRVVVPPQFNNAQPRKPRPGLSPQQLLYFSTVQDREINTTSTEIRQQQVETVQQNSQMQQFLERKMKRIEEAQKKINVSLRLLQLDSSSHSSGSHSPCPSALGDRAEFDRCSQLADENFEDYYRRLRKVAAKAQLCACCSDERMATKIALGVRDRDLSKELLSISPFPSEEKVVKICRLKEEIANLSNKTPCSGCGQLKHYGNTCPAVGQSCSRCKNGDHYFKMCPLNTKAVVSRQSLGYQMGECLVTSSPRRQCKFRRNFRK